MSLTLFLRVSVGSKCWQLPYIKVLVYHWRLLVCEARSATVVRHGIEDGVLHKDADRSAYEGGKEVNVDVITCAVEPSFCARGRKGMRRGMPGCYYNHLYILLQFWFSLFNQILSYTFEGELSLLTWSSRGWRRPRAAMPEKWSSRQCTWDGVS